MDTWPSQPAAKKEQVLEKNQREARVRTRLPFFVSIARTSRPERSMLKGISRKGAKDAKKTFKSWLKNTNDLAFLCEIATRRGLWPLREIFFSF